MEEFLGALATRPDGVVILAILAVVFVAATMMYMARSDKTDENMAQVLGLFSQAMGKIGLGMDKITETQSDISGVLLGIKRQLDANDLSFNNQLETHDKNAIERYQTLLSVAQRNAGAIEVIPVSLQSITNDVQKLSVKTDAIIERVSGHQHNEIKNSIEQLRDETARLLKELISLVKVGNGNEKAESAEKDPITETETNPARAEDEKAESNESGNQSANSASAGLDSGGIDVGRDSSGGGEKVGDKGTSSAEIYLSGESTHVGSGADGHSAGAGGVSGAAADDSKPIA